MADADVMLAPPFKELRLVALSGKYAWRGSEVGLRGPLHRVLPGLIRVIAAIEQNFPIVGSDLRVVDD